MIRVFTALAALPLVVAPAACARSTAQVGGAESRTPVPASTVTAVVRDATGRSLGTLSFSDALVGITVRGRLTGLPPGTHGMHLHAVGRCDPPTFASAGGHWNPTGRQHGMRNPDGPHFGDLPNLVVGSDSSATVDATTPGGSLRGANPLLDADGAALVLHAGPDDYLTDPAGSSGARIACGVVTPG